MSVVKKSNEMRALSRSEVQHEVRLFDKRCAELCALGLVLPYMQNLGRVPRILLHLDQIAGPEVFG